MIKIGKRFIKKDYNRLGFTAARNVIPAKMVNLINEICDDISLGKYDDHHLYHPKFLANKYIFREKSGEVKQIQYLHKFHPLFLTIAKCFRSDAAILTGFNDLWLTNIQFFEKHPDISKPTHPHQDNGYYMLNPPLVITFWVALDDIDEGNGCLYYTPKSHLTPTRLHTRHSPDSNFRERTGVKGLSLSLKEHPHEGEIAAIMDSGDVVAHNCNVIHRAGANKSFRRRRALGVVFTPKVCGISEYLHKQYEKNLSEDLDIIKNRIL